MQTITLQHLDNLLTKHAVLRRCPRISYTQLLEMKRRADWAHDAEWDLGCYDAAIRYTNIAQRIIQAMVEHPDKFVNEIK